MVSNLDKDDPDPTEVQAHLLSPAHRAAKRAMDRATRKELEKKIKMGYPVIISQNGKVIEADPAEILAEMDRG